jgi:ferredoxin
VARAPKTHRVTIANVHQAIDCTDSETILHAALLAGIDFPYACASGNCGTCICHLDTGKVFLLPRGDASLTPDQVKAGQTLACRARPRGEVTVTWLGRGRR